MGVIIKDIRSKLAKIAEDFAILLREVPISRLDCEGGGVVIIAPEFWFGDLSPEQKNRQIALVKQYDHTFELIQMLFSGSPPDVHKDIKDADSQLRKWLQLEPNWSIKLDRNQNEREFRKALDEFKRLVDVLAATPTTETIIVPDTNVLLDHIVPTDYTRLVEKDTFTILLLPTILAELDGLKVTHRNEEVRNKAKLAINLIKGWRNQGSLIDGVKTHKTITVRTVATEPKSIYFASWLDKENADDRIIASIFQIYAENPTADVLLITGDINLQNKAEFASVNFRDFDQ